MSSSNCWSGVVFTFCLTRGTDVDVGDLPGVLPLGDLVAARWLVALRSPLRAVITTAPSSSEDLLPKGVGLAGAASTAPVICFVGSGSLLSPKLAVEPRPDEDDMAPGRTGQIVRMYVME